MKRPFLYYLQARDLKSNYNKDWHTVATSPVSAATALANYKKSSGRGFNSIDRQKERGVEFRIVKVQIIEKEIETLYV